MIYCNDCNACTDEIMEYNEEILCLDCYAEANHE